MATTIPDYIIAIGASAGGLEEINTFFDHTPLDGVAYVIVQHLSANFKSRMVELLSKHSKLAVMEAENGMTVKTNEVYLIPNSKFMTIHGGRLYLEDKEDIGGPHLTIDTFFGSLGADFGPRAIGVVLSGLGSDGTQGSMAIKKSGGMVLARDPENSKFGSMPSNVIATGLVDQVLDPEKMPKAIEQYVMHQLSKKTDHQANEKYLIDIADLIKERSSMDFTDYKRTTLMRRALRRAAQNNFESLENYVEFLRKTPQEVEILAKDFLISVTSFFRNMEAFDFIAVNVLPDILKRLPPGESLKMWVAGCATGEEAYSMAVLIAEQEAWDPERNPVKIFATDIDEAALLRAGKGEYIQDIEKDVSAERLRKFFINKEDHYMVCPAIRKMVIFAKHDLSRNPPYCNMDFISCRNLLIYMNPSLQERVFNMFLFGLKMQGYLFLGASETPVPITSSLEEVHKKWRIYKNLKARKSVYFDMLILPEVPGEHRINGLAREESPVNSNQGLLELMHHELASQMDYLVVCLDGENRVLKSYGDSSKFLHQENFNSDILTLMPKPLALAFGTLHARVMQTRQTAYVDGIVINHGDSLKTVSLSISPLTRIPGKQRFVVATFREDRSNTPIREKRPVFDEKAYYDQYLLDLEAQLKEAKEKLKSVYEMLDTSNENLQSYNEELISANEEMQSTNEEMQSVNEELHTINSDYELKNRELLELNDDLNNYFRSNITGQLFVNRDLVLMKFSPGATEQTNLRETDIGRPLHHISNNISFDTIIDDVKEVIVKGNVLTRETGTADGKWHQVMTMPYLHAHNQIAGAIVTFNDITELKLLQLELDGRNEALQRINADLENFVHIASHDLLGPLGNVELGITMMNQKITDPALNDYLQVINRSIQKFSSLIKDIGHIAGMESELITTEQVDLDEIIDHIEWSLENKIKLSGAVILRDFEVSRFFFSKNNLRSVLYNLISNAIKFRNAQPPIIRIHNRREAEYMVLTVSDNGIGMEKSSMENIFNIHGRINQEIEGNGIGLYLTKRIVTAARGKITVDSEPGKGSTFTLYLKTADQQD
mgnify:CR=1 FL=1|jgi:Methylase of chemotaxis methyl-accepting proteins